MAFFYTSVGTWRINSGLGDDLMEIDYSAAGSDVVFDGVGGGENDFVADDRLNPNKTVWVINPDFPVELAAVWRLSDERRQHHGDGRFKRRHFHHYQRQGLRRQRGHVRRAARDRRRWRANDTFTIGEEDFPATFNAAVRLDGQDGNDTFDWYGVNNVYFGTVHPVSLVGGPGSNVLTVDDKLRSDSGNY